MSSSDNFEIDNSPGDDVIADGGEQESGNDTEGTDSSLEPPAVEEGTLAGVHTLHGGDERGDGPPPEDRIPDAPEEEEDEEEEEEEVKSEDEKVDSQKPAASARSSTSLGRSGRGLLARAGTRTSEPKKSCRTKRQSLRKGEHYPAAFAEDSDKGDDSGDDSDYGRRRSSHRSGLRSTEWSKLEKMPSMPKDPTGIDTRVWLRELSIMFGNNIRMINLMKKSSRREIRERGATLSAASSSDLIKQAKRAGLPSEIIQSVLDQTGATLARNRLVNGNGQQWKGMTMEGFIAFARTPEEEFALCMAIMERLVSWTNSSEDLQDAELGEGVTMSVFLKHPKMKDVRQVLLSSDPSKWTVELYKMKVDIVAAAVNYKKGFIEITQDAVDMCLARLTSGLLGPIQRKTQERKRAVEARHQEKFKEPKQWTVSEFWKLVLRVEETFIKVTRTLSYVRYANREQTVNVGSVIYEWDKEADYKKSERLQKKGTSVPKNDETLPGNGWTSKSPPRSRKLSPYSAVPKINLMGEGGFHEEDEDSKNFTLQRRLEHFYKHRDLYEAYGYTEAHVRAQPGYNPCFWCGASHRKDDWENRKGVKFRGIPCAEVARMSGKTEEPGLGKAFRDMWRDQRDQRTGTRAFAGQEEEKDSGPTTKMHLMRAEINLLQERLKKRGKARAGNESDGSSSATEKGGSEVRMLETDEDDSSNESEPYGSDEGTVMTVGKGPEVEWDLKGTPKNVQQKHKRMKQVNKIYDVRGETRDGEQLKKIKKEQHWSRYETDGGSSNLDKSTMLPFIAVWVLTAMEGVTVGVAALWDSGATKVYGSDVWFQYLVSQKAIICSQVYASPRRVGGSCGGASWILGWCVIIMDFGYYSGIPYVMEIVSNLGVNCIIGWRFMLLLGAGTEPSLVQGSFATITNPTACIPNLGVIKGQEMPYICIKQSGNPPDRLGKLFPSKIECEAEVKRREESKAGGASSTTCNSMMKQLNEQYENGDEDKDWGHHIMNTAEIEKIKKKE